MKSTSLDLRGLTTLKSMSNKKQSPAQESDTMDVRIYFSDFFNVTPQTIDEYGALNISLINDLPLFIDPFLLFYSPKAEYQELHEKILDYLSFLREKSTGSTIDSGLISSWYRFGEVKQTWLGFSKSGNRGRGLGENFARKLDSNLRNIFPRLGQEQITQSTHLEKLCLIERGVGADSISDYTTNLIVGYLAQYTQDFATQYLAPEQCKTVSVPKVDFSYKLEKWMPKSFVLPYFKNDFVLLTPRDILVQDDTWINGRDLIKDFENIPSAIPNEQLRATINNYFEQQLPKRKKVAKNGALTDEKPSKTERDAAIYKTLRHFPEIIDYFIRQKEENGERAISISESDVLFVQNLFIDSAKAFALEVGRTTAFYSNIAENSYQAAMQRLLYLKQVIENQDGYKIFYIDGVPIKRESDLQLLYKLVWFGTPHDVNAEVNNGRGSVDFKISEGSRDKTLVEFKLASNPKLKQNLQNQVEIYKKANQTDKAIKAILYFSESELAKINKVLKELEIESEDAIVLIDARSDNKPSASNVK